MGSTSASSTASPQQSVLETLELFEMILQYLSMQELLFVQLVCKQWKMMIESSSALQEALYFKPRFSVKSLSSSSNTALPRSRKSKFAAKSKDGPRLTSDDFARNALLESKFRPFFSKLPNACGLFKCEDLLSIPWNKNDRSRAAYARANASWRKMLLVQPASAIPLVEILYVTCTFDADQLSIADKSIDPLLDGLRMGWVYDRCYEMAFRRPGSFALRWNMLKSEQLWAPCLTILLRRTMHLMPTNVLRKGWESMQSQAYSEADIEYRLYGWEKPVSGPFGPPREIGRISDRYLLDDEDVVAAAE